MDKRFVARDIVTLDSPWISAARIFHAFATVFQWVGGFTPFFHEVHAHSALSGGVVGYGKVGPETLQADGVYHLGCIPESKEGDQDTGFHSSHYDLLYRVLLAPRYEG